MGRINYVCAICSEHFTRKYNGRRHNLKAHGGGSEIVRLIDYLAGRQSGEYMPNSPFWYTKKEKLGLYGSNKMDASPAFQPLNPRYRENYEESQFSERATKIKELERLLYKHRLLLNQDPQTLLRSIIAYSSSRDDDSVIDEKLERLRAIDRKY